MAIEQTERWIKRIGKLQRALLAEKRQALLIILQGMDGSGKDSTAARIFAACSPLGVRAISFKKPTENELAHDFLWRVHSVTPEKGIIQLFIRSHYEDVLFQRVHKWISEQRVRKRIQSINAFEELLRFDNNTVVLKYYLHISRQQQRVALQERIDDPKKRWKHDPKDWVESKHWDAYIRCYEDVINQSSTPWHVVPVDKKWYRDFLIAKVTCETLEQMKPRFPRKKAQI